MLGTGIGWPTIYHKEEAMADVIIRVSKTVPTKWRAEPSCSITKVKSIRKINSLPSICVAAATPKTSPFAMAATTPRALKLRRPQASQEELGELLTTVPFPGLSETSATWSQKGD